MFELTVVAKATAKLGKDSELEQTWKVVIHETMKEQGCRSYTLFRSNDNPLDFMTIERWASQRALDSHMKSAHVTRLISRAPELVNGQVEIKIYTQVE